MRDSAHLPTVRKAVVKNRLLLLFFSPPSPSLSLPLSLCLSVSLSHFPPFLPVWSVDERSREREMSVLCGVPLIIDWAWLVLVADARVTKNEPSLEDTGVVRPLTRLLPKRHCVELHLCFKNGGWTGVKSVEEAIKSRVLLFPLQDLIVISERRGPFIYDERPVFTSGGEKSSRIPHVTLFKTMPLTHV